MAPSASLQSRINAFERLDSNGNGPTKLNGGVRLPPLKLSTKPVQPHILDFDSTSPTADSLVSIPPIQPVSNSSRPSSPAALGRKSSLIDFSELSSPQLRPVFTDGTGSTISSTSASDSPKRPRLPPRILAQLPPLPPRKPSVASLNSTPTTIPPPLPKRHASSPISSSGPTISNSPSFLNPPGLHTYPPASPRRGMSPGLQTRHMPSSSTSSFHSVSLSSDGGDTHESLDGSYEAVSSTAATSPTFTQHDWELDFQPTPKPSQRQKQGIPLFNTSPPPAATRRPPPPPPPQRRPAKSNSPMPMSPAHHRPVPIPSNARKRYGALFERNLPQNSRKGHVSGWRGLSVDLIPSDDKPELVNESSDDRLNGTIVKRIWTCSKLPRARLREIWSECDPKNLGSLDREAFSKGMWRIDETLRAHRQTQNEARLPSAKSMSVSYTPRAPPPPLRKPNFLLR